MARTASLFLCGAMVALTGCGEAADDPCDPFAAKGEGDRHVQEFIGLVSGNHPDWSGRWLMVARPHSGEPLAAYRLFFGFSRAIRERAARFERRDGGEVVGRFAVGDPAEVRYRLDGPSGASFTLSLADEALPVAVNPGSPLVELHYRCR